MPHLLTEIGLLALALIWGFNFVLIKASLGEFDPLAFNALRFPLASLVLWLILRFRGHVRLPEPGDRLRILGLGILGNIVYQSFFIFGLDATLAGNASLLMSTTPVWTTVLSWWAGHEVVRTQTWWGLGAAVVGVGLVVAGGTGPVGWDAATLPGDLLILLGALAWSVYTVAGRGMIRKYGSLRVTAWTLWVGTAGLVAAGFPNLLRTPLATVSPQAWAGVAYAGILAIGVAYLLWNQGVKVFGNARTASHSNLVPVVALLAAWWLLGERPTAPQIAGATLIIAGVTLGQGWDPGSRRRRWRTSGNS